MNYPQDTDTEGAPLAEEGLVKPSKPRKSAKQRPPQPTGLIFLGEEDQKILKKIQKRIINKLGITDNRSVKV